MSLNSTWSSTKKSICAENKAQRRQLEFVDPKKAINSFNYNQFGDSADLKSEKEEKKNEVRLGVIGGAKDNTVQKFELFPLALAQQSLHWNKISR